jgi:hypothetical protein
MLHEGKNIQYRVKERDHGDQIVYDVFWQDDYLFTVSKEGEILFMNFEASDQEKETFKLSFLSKFIDQIRNND